MDPNALIHPLIALAREQAVNADSLFVQACRNLDQADLAQKYAVEMLNAPRRGAVQKSYLIESHQGISSTGNATNRAEEHLALAIFNHYRPPNPGLRLPDGQELSIVDYQLPLKARQADAGVGKIDLFGITQAGHAAIIELKAATGGDTPLRALLEGLAYAAILQANAATLRAELHQRYNLLLASAVPSVIVMAPAAYWATYRTAARDSAWESELQALADQILHGIGVPVAFVALHNADFRPGLAGTPARLDGPIACQPALR